MAGSHQFQRIHHLSPESLLVLFQKSSFPRYLAQQGCTKDRLHIRGHAIIQSRVLFRDLLPVTIPRVHNIHHPGIGRQVIARVVGNKEDVRLVRYGAWCRILHVGHRNAVQFPVSNRLGPAGIVDRFQGKPCHCNNHPVCRNKSQQKAENGRPLGSPAGFSNPQGPLQDNQNAKHRHVRSQSHGIEPSQFRFHPFHAPNRKSVPVRNVRIFLGIVLPGPRQKPQTVLFLQEFLQAVGSHVRVFVCHSHAERAQIVPALSLDQAETPECLLGLGHALVRMHKIRKGVSPLVPEQTVATSLANLACFHTMLVIRARRKCGDEHDPVGSSLLCESHSPVIGLLIDESTVSHLPKPAVVPGHGEGTVLVANLVRLRALVGSRADVRRAHFVGSVLQGDKQGIRRHEAPGIFGGTGVRNHVRVHVLVRGPVGTGNGGEFDDGRIRPHNGFQTLAESIVGRQLLPIRLQLGMHVHVDSPREPVLVLNDVPALPHVILPGDPVPQLGGRLVGEQVRVDRDPVGEHVVGAVLRAEIVPNHQVLHRVGAEIFHLADPLVVRGIRVLAVLRLEHHELELRVQIVVVESVDDQHKDQHDKEGHQRSIQQDPSKDETEQPECGRNP
mmetsp:Transcript_23994/g.66490  ORF Transcript_23994/g.66490 Transcript_23994/m.66490 type:complete len:614 (+) Transcript_23994:1226-3067(+)